MKRILTLLALIGTLAMARGSDGALMLVEAAQAQEKKAAVPAGPPPEFEYVELAPLLLPVITSRGLTQQVSLVVSLETPYGKKAEVTLLSPRLSDAYIQDLYGVLGSGRSMISGGVVDVQFIKQRLKDVATRVLGADRVHNVLLQVVHQRQL